MSKIVKAIKIISFLFILLFFSQQCFSFSFCSYYDMQSRIYYTATSLKYETPPDSFKSRCFKI